MAGGSSEPATASNSCGDGVCEEWVRRYHNPMGSSQAFALAADANGVYVTGSSPDALGDYDDYVTVKYGHNGNELWVRRYDGPAGKWDGARAIALDDAGNVYVTGMSVGSGTDTDIATIKYDSEGNEIWVVRYDGPASQPDDATLVAVDGGGNVYVGGVAANDFVTIKYDSVGNETWATTYDGGSFDNLCCVAVDSIGNVYISGGASGNPETMDYVTLKYDADGNQLWLAQYDGPASDEDQPTSLAVDEAGNVYVTGHSRGVGTGRDYTTIKYDSAGSQLWVTRYEPGETAYALALDSGGNSYVTGGGIGLDGVGNPVGGSDFHTVKYDPNGNQLWATHYNAPPGNAQQNDTALSVAVDAAGSVYVTGPSDGQGTDRDFATVKYNSDGSEAWVVRYDNGNPPHISRYDSPIALALNDAGTVYVTGRSISPTVGHSDYTTIKYSQPPPSPPPGPPAVGGIVELRTDPDAQSEQSASRAPLSLPASVALGLLVIGAGALYVMRMRRG